MITESVKAVALARIKHQVPIEQISRELDIPEKLVKEWGGKLSENDMIAIEANIHAIDTVLHDNGVTGQEDILKSKLELAAIALTNEMYLASKGDAIHAKSIELCANAITKLYQTIVMKNQGKDDDNSSAGSGSFFKSLMQD